MDCTHERQARLDQWIEDKTGKACAFCLQAEIERLKDDLTIILKERNDLKIETERLKAESESLKERLEDVYLKDTGKTREINILTKENRELREALEWVRRNVRHATWEGTVRMVDKALKDSS